MHSWALVVVVCCALRVAAQGPVSEDSGAIVDSAMAVSSTGSRLDCSHLVHRAYEDAGYEFDYAPSRELYRGHPSFRRIQRPQAGDLIVWRGHVGIVVDPARRLFFSALRSGYKVANYTSRYWKRRGTARFLRYVGPRETKVAVLSGK